MPALWPNIEMTRGDTPEQSFKLYNPDLSAMDLTGVTVWLTVKTGFDNAITDTTAVLSHYIAIDNGGAVTASAGFSVGGIDPDTLATVSGVTSGVLTHIVPQADSTLLPIASLIYDIQVRTAAGRFKTLVRGATWTVLEDVTRRITTP